MQRKFEDDRFFIVRITQVDHQNGQRFEESFLLESDNAEKEISSFAKTWRGGTEITATRIDNEGVMVVDAKCQNLPLSCQFVASGLEPEEYEVMMQWLHGI